MEWSPWFAWSMDLVKFTITFGASALATVLVVNKIQERRARKRARQEALFQLQMSALGTFRTVLANYEVAALAAYTDVYRWQGGDKTAAMQRYEGAALGDALAAIDALEDRFRAVDAVVAQLTELWELHKKRHKIYDRVVDRQLDKGPGLNLWGDANMERGRFDRHLEEAKRLRRQIVAAVEEDILAVG